jgi:hypothetical protein
MNVDGMPGIVVGVKVHADAPVAYVDILSMDGGIVRWFNRFSRAAGGDYTFAEVEFLGERTTDTAGNCYAMEIKADNAAAMKSNGSYGRAQIYIALLRSVVIDGVPLGDLFTVTQRAIKNFASGFNADAVLLKALYLLCKCEGYAIQLGWLRSLGDGDMEIAIKTISAPLRRCQEFVGGKILRSLRHWILSL